MNTVVFTLAIAATASAVSITATRTCVPRWTASEIPCLAAPTAAQAEIVFNQISGEKKTFGAQEVRDAVDEVVKIAQHNLTTCEIQMVKNVAMGQARSHQGAVNAIKGGIADLKAGARVDLAKFTAVFKTAIAGINSLTGKCDGTQTHKTDVVGAAIANWGNRMNTASAVSITAAPTCVPRWTASQIPCLAAPTAGQSKIVFDKIAGGEATFGAAEVRSAVDAVVKIAKHNLTTCEIQMVKDVAMRQAEAHQGAVDTIKSGIADLRAGARVDEAKFFSVFKTAIGGINSLTGKCAPVAQPTPAPVAPHAVDVVGAAIANWGNRMN